MLKAALLATFLASAVRAGGDPSVSTTDGDFIITVPHGKKVYIRYLDEATGKASTPSKVVTLDMLEGTFAGDDVTSAIVNEGSFKTLLEPTVVDLAKKIEDIKKECGDLKKNSLKQQACHDVGLIYDSKADHCDDPKVVNCGPTIKVLPSHLSQSKTCMLMDYRAACQVQCVAGYEQGSGNFTCGLDGNWGGQLACKPKKCDTQKVHAWAKKRADLHSSSNCADKIDFPQTCEWTCAKGTVAHVLLLLRARARALSLSARLRQMHTSAVTWRACAPPSVCA